MLEEVHSRDKHDYIDGRKYEGEYVHPVIKKELIYNIN